MIMKNHHFYVVHVNPWPLLMTLSVFNLIYSVLVFMKTGLFSALFLSIFVSSLAAFFWWVSYSGEMILSGLFSYSMEESIKFGMILFISSEIFFFFSFFWSYFHFWLSPTLEISLSWPPVSIEPFCFFNVPLVNTAVLLFSGLTITLAHYYLLSDDMKMMKTFLGLTWGLGLIFTSLQLQEYKSSFFSISDSNFGSTFFVLTGFHGIHVLIGSMFLITVFTRVFISLNFKNESLSFELSAWYWHFVDVIWIFLYFLLYYLNY